ncbi:MAG: MBL fold metallo-hydrolase [Desulfobacterales bacterium]|nr:MBL fold metallo-hydrolase [Desulfobacterales bacterium]
MADHISSAENYTHQYREENEGSISSGNILKKVLVKLLYSLADAFFIKLYGISFLSEFEIVNYDKLIYINDEPWQIIHTPGHCEDHIALYNEKTGVLFSGDNVMRSITTWLGPPRSDIGSYVKSMKTLLELPKLEIILSAHGSPVTNPRERLKEIIKHREDRTQEVLDIIKTAGNSGISAKNIIKKMYTKEEMFKRLSSRGWVSLTLKQLIDNRQIDLIKSKKDPIYVSR